jgi:DegT/DnrJ/EryC1/StrS aminotransferase family
MTSWPAFDDKQIAVVERVLRSGRINYRTGEEGRAFDREHAEACGREYGVALANGILALELEQIEPAVRMLGTRQVRYSRLVRGRTLRGRMAPTAQKLRRSWH